MLQTVGTKCFRSCQPDNYLHPPFNAEGLVTQSNKECSNKEMEIASAEVILKGYSTKAVIYSQIFCKTLAARRKNKLVWSMLPENLSMFCFAKKLKTFSFGDYREPLHLTKYG